MRYSSNPITNKKFNTARILNLLPSDRDKYIISREGDRLDILANEMYGDIKYWWIIASANNLGKGSLLIPPGVQIRIPRLPANIMDLIENTNKSNR
jgi:hypothetical protein